MEGRQKQCALAIMVCQSISNAQGTALINVLNETII